MKKSKRARVEKWLTVNKNILKIAVIERRLGFSRGIIAKFFKEKDKRKLTTQEINEIDQLIHTICDSYDNGTKNI